MSTHCAKVELALLQPCLIWLTPYVILVNITIGPITSLDRIRYAGDRTGNRVL
jgi:hypothetical protein